MPHEHKKRGRRENQKRKHEDDRNDVSPKRQRLSEDRSMHDADLEVHGDAGDDFISFGLQQEEHVEDLPQNQFYGLLEPEEQEYYANVNSKISSDDFESDEDKARFIDAVHRETQGKEMKVASSQSCSRYLEKVIMLSTADQLRSLFAAFVENLVYLVQHRFGSHCCETLFLSAAKFVGPNPETGSDSKGLESLYLKSVKLLEPNIGYLLTERFASHTIRVLLLVLSGESLDDDTTMNILASTKKEKIEVGDDKDAPKNRRRVPSSFSKALHELVGTMLASIDMTYLRALATHPVGNPVLQLLLKLELTTVGKTRMTAENQLLAKLLPEEDFNGDSESGKFILGLIYDPTGSHLVEVLVQSSPGKLFKKLYKNMLRERMKNLSKNDTASYVAIKVLERLGKDELSIICNEILDEIPGLISRSRTGLVKVMFERCGIRSVDTTRLAETVKNAYHADDITLLPKMLKFHASVEDLAHHATSGESAHSDVSPYKADVHGSVLAQAMLQVPIACSYIHQSMLAQPELNLIAMAKNSIASRVLQSALLSPQSSLQFRRQLVPKLYGHMTELATNSAGSHVVDALWDGTSGLHFMKEKLAGEIRDNEALLRNSLYGRTVWRNWAMDSFIRHFREWQSLAKGQTSQESVQETGEVRKTAIQLARERHASKRGKAVESNARSTAVH